MGTHGVSLLMGVDLNDLIPDTMNEEGTKSVPILSPLSELNSLAPILNDSYSLIDN